jgi:hypothetical protein
MFSNRDYAGAYMAHKAGKAAGDAGAAAVSIAASSPVGLVVAAAVVWAVGMGVFSISAAMSKDNGSTLITPDENGCVVYCYGSDAS